MEIKLQTRLAGKATADCRQSGPFQLDHFSNITECNAEKIKLSQLSLKMLFRCSGQILIYNVLSHV